LNYGKTLGNVHVRIEDENWSGILGESEFER
jgi:hypothetical protein